MEWARDSLEKIARTRPQRAEQPPPKLDERAVDLLVRDYHPDHAGMERLVSVGPNAGTQRFPHELADLLEADGLLPEDFHPSVDLATDVLIIGGGGAGATAALTLEDAGLQVTLATKLRLGDSNTVMAEGGIQAALGPDDSTRRHFADSFAGGHGKNDAELLRILCERGPDRIRWLTRLGCLFDRNADGTFRLRSCGGSSAPRVLACRDYTGLEIMRVLRDALLQGRTQVLNHHSAAELLDDGHGQVAGAVLWDSQSGKLVSVSARAVLLATGGSGQLHLQGYPTSNHLGATGDGLVLAYRQGCKLVHMDSFQYHPSGACYPEALAGQLVTESIRSIGAHLLNADGERFVDELLYRDAVASAIIREVVERRGVKTPAGRYGVWLDTPLIDLKKGEGTLRRQFPGLIHRFERYGIDPARHPILVYPTLHYQNGGIAIDSQCRTELRGLWAAGEVTGGVHGTNRLMGNSLLDIAVFGALAGESIKQNLPPRARITLSAAIRHREALKKLPHRPAKTAPQLFPPASGLKVEIAVSRT
ncbi:MAG: FAD-binding protein [Nitrospinae bacterium]|nr:FAD-binding protein [Nitrospinota bacterium]